VATTPCPEMKSSARISGAKDRRVSPLQSQRTWGQHVYVDDKGQFPAKFNKWERKVIERALSKKGEVIGWLRNPPRRDYSLAVPYTRGGEDHPQYPDFLVLRRGPKKEILVDLLEPHMTDLADAAAKALGLAKYADTHGDDFDRIEFIIVVGDDIVSLDLADEHWRQKVLVFDEGGDNAKLEHLLKEVAATPGRR
jgi:type III restriction enzyme